MLLLAIGGFNPFDIPGSILQLVWTIFVWGPLGLINVFNVVLTYITSGIITDIFFGSQQNFNFANLPGSFWIFVIVSALIFSIIFVVQIIVIQFQEHVENKARFVKAVYSAGRAFIFMFLIPIFFFLANYCISQISKVIVSSFSNNGSIADYLWHLGDPTWNGDPAGAGDYGPPDNIKEYNMIAEIFGVWFMFYAIIIIGLIVVQKAIELFFLFILSPLVMVTMVVDDGKRVFVWKDMVIAKFLASTSVLIGFNLFMMTIHALMGSAVNHFSGLTRMLFITLFMCGGAISLLGFSNIIAALVGENVGISESMQSMQGVMSGLAFTAGGAKMVGKAFGFVRTERNKRKIGQAANAGNFSQENAGTGKVMDNGKEGMRVPDNWTRRGIPGLIYGAIGVGAGVGVAMVAGAKSSGLHGKNKFTRGFKKVVGTFGKPISSGAKAIGKGIYKEINPEFNTIMGSRHEKHMENHNTTFANKATKYNKKINQLPESRDYTFKKKWVPDKTEKNRNKWNNKHKKYTEKVAHMDDKIKKIDNKNNQEKDK